jgi:radical SAM protein with 4Fe4S-binding SPASM domain
MVDLAVQLGAGSLKLNPVMRSGRGVSLHEHGEALDFEEVLDLARFIRGPLQQRAPIRLVLDTPLAFYAVRELLTGGPAGMCQVRHILGILGSGEMALCGIGRTIPALCFGNLRDTSVADVWLRHPVVRQLREDLDSIYPGVCGACIHATRCLTHCVAQNYSDSGRLVGPTWLCTEADRRGVFPTSRRREGPS